MRGILWECNNSSDKRITSEERAWVFKELPSSVTTASYPRP